MTGGGLDLFVRPASREDVDALAAVELHTALTAYAGIFPPEAPTPTHDEFSDRWRSRLARVPNGVGVFVATIGDEVVGLSMADPDPESEPLAHGHLRALYVHPDHWGEGIGLRLHDTAREHLRISRPALRTLSLWVMAKNHRARARYESWGWTPTSDTQEIFPSVTELRYEIPQQGRAGTMRS